MELPTQVVPPEKVVGYVILSGLTTEELAGQVMQYLEEGWQLHGAPTVHLVGTAYTTVFYQCVIFVE